MSDIPGVSPDSEWRGPHGIGGEWLSFEQRMRKRRAAKCLVRAGLALDDGNTREAREALDEARELDPESTEIEALQKRIEAAAIRANEGASADARQPRSFMRPLTAACAAGFLLLGAGAIAFGLSYWNGGPSSRDDFGPVNAVEPAAALPETAPAAAPSSDTSPAPRRLEVVYEMVRVEEATPRLVEELPPLPASPSRPIAEAEPEEPVVMAVNRTPTPPPTVPAAPEVRSDLPVAPVLNVAAPPPPVSEPVRSASARSEPEPAEPEPARPATIPPPAPDESAVVRAILKRYERAYSSLDAAEASAVWPGVNRGALARAFDALASQRVSLGSCDVDINGPAARATCSGSATWKPKVGGGVRTEARIWNFELRKSGDRWQIQRAITQGQ